MKLTNKFYLLKTTSSSAANIGFNGNDAIDVSKSSQVSLSIFDENGIPIPVSNLSNPIHVFISKTPVKNFNFENVNTTNLVSILKKNKTSFVEKSLNINAPNSSVHLQIKPGNLMNGFLVLFKFGDKPDLQINTAFYDYAKVLCPNTSKSSALNIKYKRNLRI